VGLELYATSLTCPRRQSETTAPTVRSFAPIPEDTETDAETENTQAETETDTGFGTDSRTDD
jgi:hypothetical protein